MEYSSHSHLFWNYFYLVWNIKTTSSIFCGRFLKNNSAFLPFGSPDLWLIVIGWWEVIIGITFLFNKTTPIAIALLFMQMIGTFMPLVFLPEATFKNGNPLILTMEGQYIIKNVMIISAALVLGGRYNQRK